MNSFSKKIRAFRLRNKFTREQIANLMAISLREYSEIEEGRANPSQQFIQDVSDIYGEDVNRLKTLKPELRVIDEDEDQI